MLSPELVANANRQLDGSSIFLLVGSQRCGSNLVREVLSTNPHMVVHGEVLYPYPLPNSFHTFVRTLIYRQMPPLYDEDAMGVLDDYLVFLREDGKRSYPAKAGSIRAVGIDVKYNQLRFVTPVHHDLGRRPLLLDYCASRSIPIVHLVRTNVLQQALSIAIAEVTGAFHRFGAGAGRRGPVPIDGSRLLESARWIESETAAFRSMTAGIRVHELSYERIVSACAKVEPGDAFGPSARVLTDIATSLGVEFGFTHPTSIKKVIDRPYREIVSNYDELVASVRGSEFEPFLAAI